MKEAYIFLTIILTSIGILHCQTRHHKKEETSLENKNIASTLSTPQQKAEAIASATQKLENACQSEPVDSTTSQVCSQVEILTNTQSVLTAISDPQFNTALQEAHSLMNTDLSTSTEVSTGISLSETDLNTETDTETAARPHKNKAAIDAGIALIVVGSLFSIGGYSKWSDASHNLQDSHQTAPVYESPENELIEQELKTRLAHEFNKKYEYLIQDEAQRDELTKYLKKLNEEIIGKDPNNFLDLFFKKNDWISFTPEQKLILFKHIVFHINDYGFNDEQRNALGEKLNHIEDTINTLEAFSADPKQIEAQKLIIAGRIKKIRNPYGMLEKSATYLDEINRLNRLADEIKFNKPKIETNKANKSSSGKYLIFGLLMLGGGITSTVVGSLHLTEDSPLMNYLEAMGEIAQSF